jgi:Uma2 family endonuclease
MSLPQIKHSISTEEYLEGELLSDIKHQLINGKAYAMTGASANHNVLSLNIASEFRASLRGSKCKSFMADMKLKVADNFFYPDAMVVCGEDNENDYYRTMPSIIVEVLSKSTRKFDKTSKRLRCQAIPSLEEYVLIEQDNAEIEVFSRRDHWQAAYYYLGDHIRFESLGITLAVDDIYDQVDNEDVLSYMLQKQQIMPSSPASG